MRPLKLELKGFTVYRKPQTIDFSKLRFFVIQGKTGAGKTSIIDAITYALYGKVPRYSSQSATKYVLSKGEKELKVIFDFSVRGRKYRIERYYRAFPEDSQVRVYEEGKRINIKANQVEKWLQQISGIDYKTFTKVILLPQGEFDKFLKEGKERKNLLIKLLGLEELEKISKLAGEEFKNLEGRREALKKEYGLIKEYSPQLKERLQKELQDLQIRIEELTKKEEQMREELRKSKEKKELYEEYKRVLREYESLAEEKEEIESLKEKLEISRKVSPYVPIAKRIEEIDEILSEIKFKRQKLLKEHTILSEELKNLKEEEKKLQVEKEKAEEYRNREKEIELILKKLLEIKEYILEVETLQREKKELEKEFQKAKEEYTDLTRRVEKGRKIIEEEERKLKGIEEKFSEEEYTSLKTKERLLKELEKKEKELQKKENEYETVKEKLDTLYKEYIRVKKEFEKAEEELKKRELYYHAHMVSSYLSEGDICPVCGGTYRGKLSHWVEIGDINELKAKT
ncbi:MAG TPA: hypothetical protein EYH58_01095, partial [Aquifex aeolicus]|nr:hypothetical protein [Aquifex aeolicus]